MVMRPLVGGPLHVARVTAPVAGAKIQRVVQSSRHHAHLLDDQNADVLPQPLQPLLHAPRPHLRVD
eukprot:951474-Pyramimonas_sp.AAC.1